MKVNKKVVSEKKKLKYEVRVLTNILNIDNEIIITVFISLIQLQTNR